MSVTTPLRIAFGPAVCTSPAEGGDREWLVADGCGGYAMGTVCGLRTRRYHGLLVPAVGGPATRHLGLVALDPVLMLPSGAPVRLATHEWAGGAVAPTGHTYLESFDLDDGLPRWRWRVGDVVLERELAMRHGASSVAVVHRLLAGGPCRLVVEALVTWRDAHGERFAGGPLPVEHVDGGAVVEGSFRLRGPGWAPAGDWYRGVHARLEARRGLNAEEDVWRAGRFAADLSHAGGNRWCGRRGGGAAGAGCRRLRHHRSRRRRRLSMVRCLVTGHHDLL
ncbi:MAG: glycogen debranching enzyme N-terminal domain-containing protein [Actinomycetota bacterium]|nr:glycogen debranching enzyme N-terminal domain-containing protein [Actinomycetota bacterium]